jgi:antitoxin (DNA-binding transcriptional repressor) of toxin-antitoxin stability system
MLLSKISTRTDVADHQVQCYEAETHLPRLPRALERGETVIITRHGKPVAQLAPGQDRRREKIANHRTG